MTTAFQVSLQHRKKHFLHYIYNNIIDYNMSQNNSQQNKPLGNTPDASPSETKQTGMVIVTDFALWNYLFQGYVNQGAHRYSRAEAFFDLVNRQRLAYLTGDGEFLEAGIQQLANIWSWDRTSVRKFIGSLCEMGAASIETKANRTCIRLTNIASSDPLGHLTRLSSHPQESPLIESNLRGGLRQHPGEAEVPEALPGPSTAASRDAP